MQDESAELDAALQRELVEEERRRIGVDEERIGVRYLNGSEEKINSVSTTLDQV